MKSCIFMTFLKPAAVFWIILSALSGSVWGTHESQRVLIKAKSPGCVCVCVLKCLGVRHTTHLIDEHATRPFKKKSFSQHSFPPCGRAEATRTEWGFCSGNPSVEGGSEFGCVFPSLKYVGEESSRRRDRLYLMVETRCFIL